MLQASAVRLPSHVQILRIMLKCMLTTVVCCRLGLIPLVSSCVHQMRSPYEITDFEGDFQEIQFRLDIANDQDDPITVTSRSAKRQLNPLELFRGILVLQTTGQVSSLGAGWGIAPKCEARSSREGPLQHQQVSNATVACGLLRGPLRTLVAGAICEAVADLACCAV